MSEKIERILENVENKTGCFDFLATITPNATDHLIEKLKQENHQLKEVIDEVRKFVDEMFNNEPANSREYDYYCGKLLQILDKVKDVK